VGITPHRLFASDLAHALGLREDVLQRYFLHARQKNAFFILVTLARPESRGEFCVTSKDPYKAPIIDPKFLSHPNDLPVMIEGIQR
jgi:choline dehydrogenase-like flavoprotein